MLQFLKKRKIITHVSPYFLPPVYISFLKIAVKERNIAVLWFFIHILSFFIFLFYT